MDSHKSIAEVAELLRTRKLSPVEITHECLTKIEKLNPILNAFITVMAESALTQARAAELEIQHGSYRGVLHGIPIGLKDLIDTALIRTTAASAHYEDRVPTEDAEIVKKLKTAGAIIIGKHNLHEFAFGGSSLVSYYGDVHNPRNPAHVAGGSSGGSAAAVAAGLCYGAVGTDTAGSIREPAALCGIVGLKPTYGAISTRGVIPLSESLDHVGPLARTVEDAEIIFRVIRDKNGELPLSAKEHFKIGIPRKFFYDNLDPEVAGAIESALLTLERSGHKLLDIEVQISEDRTLQYGETYAHHAKLVAESPELYQPETLRRIWNGENITAADIIRCREELKQFRRDAARIFETVDFLITPATPVPAPLIADLKANMELLRPQELLLLRNTRPVNVWGLPAISIPCGLTQAGLPIGLQIVGAPNAELSVFNVAASVETRSDH